MKTIRRHSLLALGVTLLTQPAAMAVPYNIVSENTLGQPLQRNFLR